MEANPLHNGHIYFINKAIEKVKPDYTVCVISTNFTSRGEVSVINKFDKTKYLLSSGIDIVLENPFVGYNASADYFAYNSINILNKFKITDIAFGVELYDYDKLIWLENITSSNNFNVQVKKYLDKGYSYSTACNKSLEHFTDDLDLIDNYSKPNNTLAIQYIKAIKEINNSINIHLIERVNNNYYDNNTTGFISSATSLRNSLSNNIDISNYTPFKMNYIDLNMANNNLYMLLKYKLINSDFNYLGVKEGFENRLKSECLNNHNSIDEYIKSCESKRYKTNYIKRVIMNILMEIPSSFNQIIDYLRILGFNNHGNNYINKLDKETKKMILTSPKNTTSQIMNIEVRATMLYGIITDNLALYLEEYKIPIKL